MDAAIVSSDAMMEIGVLRGRSCSSKTHTIRFVDHVAVLLGAVTEFHAMLFPRAVTEFDVVVGSEKIPWTECLRLELDVIDECKIICTELSE